MKRTTLEEIRGILEKLNDVPTEIMEEVDKELNRKTNPVNEKNKELTEGLLEDMKTIKEPKTVTELIEICPTVTGLSCQKVSYLLKKLVEEGLVTREMKRKSMKYQAIVED